MHVEIARHPAGRYWKFQCYEIAICTALAALVLGMRLWRIRRQPT